MGVCRDIYVPAPVPRSFHLRKQCAHLSGFDPGHSGRGRRFRLLSAQKLPGRPFQSSAEPGAPRGTGCARWQHYSTCDAIFWLSSPCDASRTMLTLLTSPDGRERLLEKADNMLFMASDKTGIVSIVFLRIITHPFFGDKIIMHRLQ